LKYNFLYPYSQLILVKSLLMGWLLSFPYYGPVLQVNAPDYNLLGYSLPFIFIFFHALSFLAGAVFIREVNKWKTLMLAGAVVTTAVHVVLLFAPAGFWPLAMAVTGISSAVYILGWSYPYSETVPVNAKLKVMSAVIIGANIVYIFNNFLSQVLPPVTLLAVSVLPLVASLLLLVRFSPEEDKDNLAVPYLPSVKKESSTGVLLYLVLCLFIAGVFIFCGFKYVIIQPSLGDHPLFVFSRYIPYISVLFLIFLFGDRLKWNFSLYTGISLLGLSYVSFALLYGSTAGLFTSQVLVESAYAFLDLFVWVILGYLAFIYGVPFRIFGFALFTMQVSVMVGEYIGQYLINTGEQYRMFAALLVAAVIFLVYTVMPWLNERMQKDFEPVLNNNRDTGPEDSKVSTPGISTSGSGKDLQREQPSEKLLLFPDQALTPRETEIVTLLLQGLPNRQIAEKLFISENTLKTHLKNIYPKFGVTRKNEFLSLMINHKKSISQLE